MNQNIRKYEEQSYETTDFRIKNIGKAIKLLIAEYNRLAKDAPFNSAYEGWAVLKAETDDLWNEVKKSEPERSKEAIRREVVSVGAEAMRFIVDLCLADEICEEKPIPIKEIETVA